MRRVGRGYEELPATLARDRTHTARALLLALKGNVGCRFFGEFILDCLNRTKKAMTQAHAFKAAELCLRAQAAAQRLQTQG